MTHAVTLLLGVHAHQPVGNFPEVIEDAHLRCYKPFLETLYAYPDFRFAAHFSGWLLDWLRERYPADMALLAEMVKRGQVELFSSGDTSRCWPPFRIATGSASSHAERQAHRLDRGKTQRRLAHRAGLGIRRWCPALAETGIRYVTVDDYHFFCTGKSTAALDGYFSTEEDGTRLDLFPISEALRYRLPFSPAHEVVGYLEYLADQGQAAAIYFDDIEKFGIWPETYDWVYNRGWLKALIEGVLASPKIRTATYADFHAPRANARHRLFADHLLQRDERMDAADARRRHLFRPAGQRKGRRARRPAPALPARRHLAQLPVALPGSQLDAQAHARRFPPAWPKCPHPPQALTDASTAPRPTTPTGTACSAGFTCRTCGAPCGTTSSRWKPELDALQPRPAIAAVDLDFDGKTELFAQTAEVQIVIRDDGLAAAHELSAIGSITISATPCAATTSITTTRSAKATEHHGEGIASAHDIVRFKHPVSAEDIVPDVLPRALWLDEIDGDALTDYAPIDSADPALQPPRHQ
jgi:hypothetical protein